jgi:transcriptional regulator with XRE-family HTH domain
MVLGQEVARRRSGKGWDQAALAKRARTSPTTLSSIENGKTATNLALIEAIADALGCAPWELLQPEGAKPSPDPALTRLALIGRITVVLGALPADKLQALLDFAESLADPPPAKLPSDPAKPHKQVK